MRHRLPLKTYGTDGTSALGAFRCHPTVGKTCGPASEMALPLCNDSVQALTHREYQQVAATTQDNNSTLPTISDLLYLAVVETDFVSDLDPATLEANCQNSIDLAADIYEDRHDIPVPLSLIQWARCALLLEAEAMLRDREAHAEAERLDAITAGDIDHAGNFISYDTYRGV